MLCFILTIINVTVINDDWVHWNDNPNKLQCDLRVSKSGQIFFLPADIFFTVVCLVLFVKPAREIVSNLQSKDNKDNSYSDPASKFKFLTEKYCKLTSITLISNILINMLFVIFPSPSSVVMYGIIVDILILDNATNVICMLLLSGKHHDLHFVPYSVIIIEHEIYVTKHGKQ